MRMGHGGWDWKDAMFKQHAAEFASILAARQVSVDTVWLGSQFPNAQRRMSILDLGCGTGRLLKSLSKIGTLVVGLDYAAELLEHATAEVEALGNVALVQGDMRKLKDLFPKNHFQLIIRAYTSLGYFDRTVERGILSDCADISTPDARLIIDTFNTNWFRVHRHIERASNIGNFVLCESYDWNEKDGSVSCLWRYLAGDQSIAEIPFVLDGYTRQEVDAMLAEAGWERQLLIKDIQSFEPLGSAEESERLVVVARKSQ